MTRMRWLTISSPLAMPLLRRIQWQYECKGRAAADSFTAYREGAADLPRGEGTAVQAESVAFLFRRKAVGEQPFHMLGGNSHAVVDDLNLYCVPGLCDAHDHLLIRAARCIAGVFGITLKIYQDLQDFMLVHRNGRNGLEFALQRDAMACECGAVHRQAVFPQGRHIDGLADTATLCVGLLG